ncbi:MAG TPA: hypothetical protein ENN63_07405 [Bacteroidetes bacterium]|nr:hypothetical protein [Bacteroidota bacterium]
MKIQPYAVYLLVFPFILTSCPDRSPSELSGGKALKATPQLYISYLPAEIRENSGMILYDGLVWTFNDSGGGPLVYGLHPRTGRIVRRVQLDGAENRDWEAITQDEHYIYVGDVGNNSGARTDLKIYRLRKDDMPDGPEGRVPTEAINLLYEEQWAGGELIPDRRFDCEAMVAWNDSLVLFTKDWVNEQTMLFSLPAVPGVYRLYPTDSFPAGGLITGAAFLPGEPLLVLCGYSNFAPFLWLFQGFESPDFFSGKNIRIEMPELFRIQTEGVYLKNADSLFISSEATDMPPQMYLLKLKSFRNRKE